MNENETAEDKGTRDAASAGLAIVGFIALVALGIWLAIYSARYVPGTIGRIGEAAVAWTSIFNPAPSSPTTSTGTTTPPDTSSTISTTTTPTTTISKPASTGATAQNTQPGQETNNVYPITGATTTTSTQTLYGQPDLTTTITATGYLTTATTSSFVEADTVPSGSRPALKFTIKNIGTNVMPSGWVFSAVLPTGSSYLFFSDPQQALNPGDSIDYTLGFDQSNRGSETITITANANRTIGESDINNNQATATFTVLGS